MRHWLWGTTVTGSMLQSRTISSGIILSVASRRANGNQLNDSRPTDDSFGFTG